MTQDAIKELIPFNIETTDCVFSKLPSFIRINNWLCGSLEKKTISCIYVEWKVIRGTTPSYGSAIGSLESKKDETIL